MSGICDTCKREHCHAKMDGLKSCDFHEGGESNYTRLFGTPERAAQTIYDVLTCVKAANDCGKCELKGLCVRCGNHDALLEWLEGDA